MDSHWCWSRYLTVKTVSGKNTGFLAPPTPHTSHWRRLIPYSQVQDRGKPPKAAVDYLSDPRLVGAVELSKNIQHKAPDAPSPHSPDTFLAFVPPLRVFPLCFVVL